MDADLEDFARSVNNRFDRLTASMRARGKEAAAAEARFTALASVLFLEQVAGRRDVLELIGELIDA